MQQTRREFLHRTAMVSGALAASGLGFAAENGSPPPDAAAAMSIVRWKGGGEPSADAIKQAAVKLTEEAIAALGGMKRFVKPNDVVCIKPNIAFGKPPQFACATNPDVVATLTRLCLEAGAAKVKVGDNAVGGAVTTYPGSGIEPAVKAAGGEMVYVQDKDLKDLEVNGKRMITWPLFPALLECNLFIDVPVLKDHAITSISSCMKNLMGVAGGQRQLWHRDMPTFLTDIAAFVKPGLCVLDAVRTMFKGGPEGIGLEHVKFTGTVAAGTDIVALEAFGAESLGLDVSKGKTMAAAQERGLGRIDYRSLHPKEIDVS